MDNTAPTVASIVRQAPASSPTNADDLIWRVTFSEEVTNVDAADFAVSGTTATVTAVAAVTSVTGAYDVTASGSNLADLNGTVTLSFAAGQSIQDEANNALANTAPTGANNNDYVVDNTAPTVTIGGVPDTSAAAFTATITFTEPVTGFVEGDITLANATASAFTATDAMIYTALITPTADGAVTVDVAANAATDAAGNGNAAAAQVSSVFDSTAPTVMSIVRQTPASSPTNADDLTWRVTFSENVANVNAADFTVSGTTAALTVSEVTASTVFDVKADGGDLASLDATAALSFASGQDIVDTAGNELTNTTPSGTNDNDFELDNTAPTVTISGVSDTSAAAFTATITFTEPVTGFVEGDITLANATASAFTATDAMIYTALITPTADGAVTVDVAANAATDAAGNGNAAAVQVSSVFDSTAPTVMSIVRQTPASSPTNADSLTWRVMFSENVADVNAADFTVSGTTATLTVSEVTASTVFDVKADGGDLASLDATTALSFASGQDIADTTGNELTNTTPSGTNDNNYVLDNTAPTAPTYTAPGSLKVGAAITSMSPMGASGVNEYSASGLPTGLSIDDVTGVISGTPSAADTGAASVTVMVSDTAGNSATVDITFPVVAKGDQTLSGFSYSASSVTFGSAAPTVTAPSGAKGDLSYAASPSDVCTVEAATGALTLEGAGSCTVTAAATADYNEGTDTATVTVQTAGTLVLNVDAVTGDDTVNIAEKAEGFAISGNTGSEAGVTVTVQVGTATLNATLADDNGTATWSVSVPTDASYITGASVVVTVSAAKTGFTAPADVQRTLTIDLTAPTAPSYTAPGSLKVGAAITSMSPTEAIGVNEYIASGLPTGLSINASTGVISGTPTAAATATASVTVTVSDTAGNTDTVDITFPAVAKGDQTLSGFSYSASSVTFGSAAPTLTAPGGAQGALSYAASPSDVCTVDATTGALTLTGVGSCAVTVTAAATADYNAATDTATVTVQTAGTLVLNVDAVTGDDTVNIAEKAEGFVISGTTGSEAGVTVTVQVGTATLSATLADDNGTATWSVSVPADASYITGASVVVTVSAAKTGYTSPSAVERTLTIDLTVPTVPTYTAPGSLKVGAAITSMSPTEAIGVNEYIASGLPTGLSINASTGVISGTPTAAATGVASAMVTVSDTAGNTDTVDITFPMVAKGDQTLSGFSYSASSVTFGSAAPMVTAPSGAQVALSYAASPSDVCTVEAATGALTLEGAGSCTVTVTAAATADYNEGTDTATVTVQTAGTLVLNVDAVTGDDTVNIAEKAEGFAISGNTGSEAGVTVTVQVGTATLNATLADDNGTATWSVSVPTDASYITGASVVVTVSAAKTGYTSPSAVERTLTIDLTAPTAPTYTAPGSLKVGAAITSMSPTEAIGVNEYIASGLPTGLSINASTGVISGTPTAAATGVASAMVTVSDTAGNTDTVDITFPMVAKGDQTLSGFSYSASSVTFGSAAPTVTAPSGVETTLSYAASPSNVCTVDATTGALTLAGVGSCAVTVTAAATADYNAATDTATVTVQTAGTLVLNVDAVTGDDTVNIAEKAEGFVISGTTGSEAGVAVTVQVGTATLSATLADDNGTATWSVSVPADASYITGASVVVTVSAAKTGYTSPSAVERTLTIDLTAPTAPTYTAPGSLTVGAAITSMSPTEAIGVNEYSASGLPTGLSIDDVTGVISGTPESADTATASVTVTVSDSAGNTDTVSITFPAVAKGDQTLSGFGYSSSSVTFGSAAPTLTAPGGAQGALSYAASPSGVCTVDATTGALTLTGAGSCTVTVTAAATADYNAATDSYTVTVQAMGSLALNVGAISGDNTVNIAEKAEGFAISGDTGSEAGVAVTVQVGTATLSATSADDNGTATWSVSVPADASYITGTSVDVRVTVAKTGFTAPSTVERTLTVDLVAPTAPTYTAPGSLTVGAAITSMSPTEAIGVNEYSAPGLPTGLSINAGTGVISGTPTAVTTATASVTVTVSDSAGNTDTVSITFPAVAKGDQTLSGFGYSSSSVTFGSAAPTYTAPGGAQGTLSYAATPATVCTVEATTGALTLTGVGSCTVTVTAAATADYKEATDTAMVTVQTAGTLLLNLDMIAGDNTVNIAEKAEGSRSRATRGWRPGSRSRCR